MILENQKGTQVYSDGQETERQMLKIAEQYPEDLSQTAIAESCDYTTNNTFSSVRRNILNWYGFRPGSSVLEIGAGMGSITGLLCDRCATVTSLEMNQERAAVIHARYPDRKNLRILVGNVNQLELTETFDYVVFIGVLEYAALFSDAEDPHVEFLKNAKRFLKPEGRLLFAIENQYGLKYWCGAAEDHLQEAFVGINGFQKPRTARTFSKAALKKLLEKAGLLEQRFYAALPDYKFPTMLFTDEWKPSGADLTNIAYTYGKGSLLVADERKLYADLADNDVVSFFANSFFVEASAAPLAENHPVLITARGETKREYRIVTTINSDDSVSKRAAHPFAREHLRQIERNERALADIGIKVLTGNLQDGVLSRPLSNLPRADRRFRDYIESGNLNGAWRMVENLRAALLKSSTLSDETDNALVQAGIADPDEQFGPVLRQGYVDMTFYNAFLDGEELVFFDQEWCVPKLPLEFILYYAVKSIFQRETPHSSTTLPDMLKYLGIAEARWLAYDRLESLIWENIFLRTGDFYGQGGYCTQYHNTPKLTEILGALQDENARAIHETERLRSNLQCEEGHIQQLLQSERDLKAETGRQLSQIMKQGAQIAELEESLRNKTGWVEQLIQSERALAQEVSNKEGHIRLLLESDRELNRIKSSRSWRFLGYVWKVRDVLSPKGSKRRLAGKMLVKFVKHPIRFLSKCSPKRIGKLFKTLQKEGTEGVSHRLDDCLIGMALPEQRLSVQAMDLAPGEPVRVKTTADYAPLSVPQCDEPKVSIVIPVYEQFDYTYLCVKSILENSGDISYEIILADDCSSDLTRQIDDVIHGLRTIHNTQNLRFLHNCNNAAEAAKGKYILFLNNDTQVQENWLEPLVALIELDEKIGMVGSKLVYPDGRLQEAGGIFWNDGSAWNYGNRSDPAMPEYNYVKEVDYISGAAIMIRRTLWEEIGGFDDRFAPAYCEDSDLAFEVRSRGYKVLYQPLSVVVHFEGVSNGTDTTSGQKAYQVTNQKKFYEKWKSVLEAENFPNGENVFLARDRSRNKKTLLMVDHYVPMYDKDAGSRTVFQYIKLFVDMGYNVKFIGDNFYPHQPYTQTLQQLGVEVLIGPYYAKHWKDWLKENGANIGYAFLNRPHIATNYIGEIRKHTNARIVYYGHDLHFLREQREYELTGDAGLLKSSENWKQKELALMRKADVAYYPSYIEKEEIQQLAPDVNVKAIPAYLFSDVEAQPYHAEMRRDAMFIGGFGHRPNVDAVKWLATEVMPHLLKRLPELTVYILGSNPPDEVKTLESEHLRIMGFVTDEELERYYSACRLDLVPLRYGAGIKGKVVEAMRYGMPVVTTSVGAEGISGADSILTVADSAEEFAQKAASLYQNGEELAARSAASYRYIRENFSPENARQIVGPDFDME